MSITRNLKCITSLLFSLAPTAHADLIATFETGWGGKAVVFDWMIHRAYLSIEFGADEGLGTIFEDFVIYEGENITHTLTLKSDADFAEFSDLVTDGLDWWLYDKYDFAGGIYGSVALYGLESQRLNFTDPDQTGPDLSDYAIESITRVLTVDFESPGSDPNGDGNWTDYSINGTFEIYGHPIPESSMLGPLLLLATLIKRRRGA